MVKSSDDGELRNGRKHGPWTTWYADGTKRSEGAYVDGAKDGPWVQYHKNGKKAREQNFALGKETGRCRMYYDSGKLEMEGDFGPITGKSSDGRKQGPFIYYAEDGKTVWRVITYKNGARTRQDDHPLGLCAECDTPIKTVGDSCTGCGATL